MSSEEYMNYIDPLMRGRNLIAGKDVGPVEDLSYANTSQSGVRQGSINLSPHKD